MEVCKIAPVYTGRPVCIGVRYFSHNLNPWHDSYKLSDTQSVLMYHSTMKVLKIVGLSFSKLNFKVASAIKLPQSSHICTKSKQINTI